jgi:hypothetical protein
MLHQYYNDPELSILVAEFIGIQMWIRNEKDIQDLK